MNSIIKNAILVNELRMLAKNKKTAITIFVLNLILMIVATVVMFAANTRFYTGDVVDPKTFLYYFLGLVIAEGVVVGFLVPSIASGTISGERERQTLDVLLMTDMTPWQIVMGKYLSAVVHIMFIVLSTLPIMALVFVYGNISFFTLICIYITLLSTALYLASFSVLFSASIKKTSTASVLSYIIMIALIGGTILVALMNFFVIQLVNEVIHVASQTLDAYGNVVYTLSSDVISEKFAFFVLLANPGITVFDTFVRFVGIDDVQGGFVKFLEDMLYGSVSDFGFVLTYLWTPISIAVQMLIAFLLLKAAAKKLERGEKIKKKRK